MTPTSEQTSHTLHAPLDILIADRAGLSPNDDGTYTVAHLGKTFLVEIKVHDVTEDS